MTHAKNESARHSRRSVLRAGVVASSGIIGIAFGLPGVGAQDGATPAATSVGGRVTIYSGRNEELIGPAVETASEFTGVGTEVRFGGTAEMAATLLEEGGNTPASLFVSQDAGALGQLAKEGLLAELPNGILSRVDPRFRSPEGLWVGISGRARVLVYNTDMLASEDLPTSVRDLTGEDWTGQVGWAPENGSFQAFVTAFRRLEGDEATREWLQAMIENETVTYENNASIVRAVAAGEVTVGLVNHYYKFEIEKEEGELPIENHYFDGNDPGSLVNVAGVGVMANGPDQEQALAIVDAFLQEDIQRYFAETTAEYPLIDGVEPAAELQPLDEVASPDIDLSDLDDLQGTLEMLAEVGAI
jgi:iron(III) transport system substrate-binding protein